MASARTRAERAAFLLSARGYYAAFVEAAERARRSIVIVGWDVDSRTPVTARGRQAVPVTLGELVQELAERRRGLDIYILAWDYGALHGAGGEMRPLYGNAWPAHDRIHVHYDSTNAEGACHHQKIVVIDDAIAFCGGVDFTPRPGGTATRDAVALVDGEAARTLAGIARERWSVAAGGDIPRTDTASDPWPRLVKPDVTGIAVDVSRTTHGAGEGEAAHDIEAAIVAAVARAKHSIHIDTVHFTSHRIAAALAERLAQNDAPHVVLTLRHPLHGWLEPQALRVRTAAMLDRVRAADAQQRFRAWRRSGACGDCHSTIVCVDDAWLHIGSASLSNRAMRLDSECAVSFEAQSERQAAALRIVRERAFGDVRTWQPLEIAAAAADAAALDNPEPTVALDTLVEEFAPETGDHAAGPAWSKLVCIALGVVALTAIWRYTPVSDVFTADRVIGWAEGVGAVWWAPLVVMAAYSPACFVMFPRPLITLFAVIAFGPALGLAYSLLGILGAALATYYAGRLLPRDTVRRLAGDKLNEMTEVLRRRGLIAIFAVRIVPVAPFAVEGMVAGAVGIRLAHYALGTVLGMLPGTLTTTVFGEQIKTALADPAQINYWLVAAVALFFVGVIWTVRRWFLKEHRLARAHAAEAA